MPISRSLPLLSGALLLCIAGPAGADATLTYTTQGDQPGSQTIAIAGDKLRLGVEEGEGEEILLYDATADLLTVLDGEAKTYMEMDQQTAENLNRTIQGMQEQLMAQLQTQLEGMSPEERQAMEQMMGQMMGQMGSPAQPPERRTQATGRSETVNGFDCQVFELYEDDVKQQELCMAGREALGLDEPEYRTARGLLQLMERMGGGGLALAGVEGLPVRIVDFEEDGQRVSELSGLEGGQSLDPALFQVPEGYTKQDPFTQ